MLPVQLPADPSDEELARDWALRPADLAEVRRCNGEEMRHSFAIQLCMVRNCGRFLDDYAAVPVRILNHVGRQLGLAPVLIALPPARKETDATHERRIRAHLGFTTFGDSERKDFEQWIHDRAAEGVLIDELIVRAEHHLFERKVIVPARSTVERIVRSIASSAEDEKMLRIHSRVPVALRTAIDALVVVPEGAQRSPLEELREAVPDPTPEVMNRFLKRASDLRALDLGDVDLSGLAGVAPEVVTHLADLVQRHDVAHLRRFGTQKACAMVTCFLIEQEKSLLDDLVEMHHVCLLGLERRSRNTFRERCFQVRHELRKNVGTLTGLAKAVSTAEADCTIGAFRKDHVDDKVLREAIAGCIAFERLEMRGVLDAQVARHGWLKQYLPQFLRLPFEGGHGTEPLLGAITYARACHAREDRALGRDAPVEFAKGMWRKAIETTMSDAGPDLRVWELALAFEVGPVTTKACVSARGRVTARSGAYFRVCISRGQVPPQRCSGACNFATLRTSWPFCTPSWSLGLVDGVRTFHFPLSQRRLAVGAARR